MKIKVFEAFAGYGSQHIALKRLAKDFPDFSCEVVGISEIDKNPILAYNALHPGVHNYGDISQIDWHKVPDFDLFTYSFPCGLKGTMVLTQSGYKDISFVTINDKVMTHNNRYKDVVRTMSRMCDSHYRIKAIGCDLRLTAEHPLYVLRDGVEQWIKVKDLQKTDMLSYCIPNGDTPSTLSNDTLWLLGRYVADGYINKHLHHSVEFAIGKNKEGYFLDHLPEEFKGRIKRFEKSCYEYRIADENFQELCLQLGVGAKNKRIPQWVIDMPNEQIDYFLDGYFSGDGHVRYRSGSKVQMFTTVSKQLFLGIQLLLLKRHKKVCSLSIRHDSRKESFNDTYNGQFVHSNKSLQKTIGYRVYVPIRNIEFVKGDVQVYNLEVADDNSYTCDNVNTHNCTDISNAGKQEGFTEGSGTRSSLLWECQKAIEVKRPKFLLMENVKALTQKKFMPEFIRWQNTLTDFGYVNYWKVLNAKDFGVSQNRERVFMVSIHGEHTPYEFPEGFPLEKCVEDYLLEEVDENYYIDRERITNKVLSDILDQPNVRAEMEKLYHEEWEKHK